MAINQVVCNLTRLRKLFVPTGYHIQPFYIVIKQDTFFSIYKSKWSSWLPNGWIATLRVGDPDVVSTRCSKVAKALSEVLPETTQINIHS